jgi:hypothetical protein
MTSFEHEYWQHQAALLDPRAYVFMSPTTVPYLETVPPNTTWYCLNSWWLDADTVGDIQQFHRPLAIRHAVIFPTGTEIRYNKNYLNAYAFAYWCRPELVVRTDRRYHHDARDLYFERLYKARRLAKLILKMNSANPTALFPSGMSNGLLLHASCHDAPWVVLNVPQQTGQAGAGINVNGENSDSTPVQRFTIGNMLVPFSCKVISGAMLSTNGQGADPAQGVVSYVSLPSDW